MDQWLQPPGTPDNESWFHQRVDEIFAPAAPDLPGSVAGAITSVKNYFAPRRNDLYVTHSIDRLNTMQPTDILSEFVDNVRYFVPSDNSLGTTWTELADPANIAAWGTGQAGFGYEDSPGDYQDLIRTNVRPGDACATCTSIYLRVPFEIDDLDEVRDLTLRMKYDDGYVAYINGTEVSRSVLIGTPGFDSTPLLGIQHSGVGVSRRCHFAAYRALERRRQHVGHPQLQQKFHRFRSVGLTGAREWNVHCERRCRRHST